MFFIIWCTAVVFQVLLQVVQMILIHKPEKPSKPFTPTISVIVAARNEVLHLKALINSLLNQEYSKYEIILVLDRCEDDSLAIANAWKDSIKIIETTEVPTGWNPKKYALNEGVKQAAGEWLVFTDADCRPASALWLKTLSDAIDDETEILIGVSPYKANRTFLSQFIQYENLLTAIQYIASTKAKRPYMAVGRNMAVKRSFFVKKRGYESFKGVQGGDDDLFIQRHATGFNTKAVQGFDSLTFTFPSRNFKEYLHQKRRHLAVGSRYKGFDQGLLSMNHLSLLIIYLFVPFVLESTLAVPLLFFFLFIKFVNYSSALRKFGMKTNYILFPFVDMLYAVLIPVIALWTRLEKDTTWKN